MRIHQFIPYLHGPGDGAADQVRALESVFRAAGHECRTYALEWDAEAADGCHHVEEYLSTGAMAAEDVLLYHYVTGSPMTALLRALSGPVLLYYQNVTPPDLVAPFNADLARSLQAGRDELRTLCHLPAMAPSEYSRQELLALGFRQVRVVPLLLDLERLVASARTAAGRSLVAQYADGSINWLSVGRIAPNKCLEDVIKSFAFYQRLIRARARLFLVGSDLHFEGYQLGLAHLAERLGVEVHFPGRVPYEQGFGAYYELASVYVCMSEHEGFCAPLIEASRFGVPVIGYSAAAVPETLGASGVLVKAKRYEAIAELAELLACDQGLRERIVAGGRARLAAFSPERVGRVALEALDSLLEGTGGPG